LVTARQTDEEGVGFVGDVEAVNPGLIEILAQQHIPVISSVAADETGQSYNINADTFAGEIAAALGAEKLVLMTDTPGLMRDFHDPSSLIAKLDIREARQLIDTGVVSGGMIPKLNCCIRSLAQGVRAAHIIDGRMAHSLLLETFTDSGIGTMLTA
jgi:acetylglutamate kinase